MLVHVEAVTGGKSGMGRRFYEDRIPEWARGRWYFVSFYWSFKPGQGRFWKRQLSKVRRRALDDRHTRGLGPMESRCNWKNW